MPKWDVKEKKSVQPDLIFRGLPNREFLSRNAQPGFHHEINAQLGFHHKRNAQMRCLERRNTQLGFHKKKKKKRNSTGTISRKNAQSGYSNERNPTGI